MTDPVRTCIGCGARRPKVELVRVVADGERVAVDEAKRAAGRGAYVCDGRCAQKAVGKRALARALKRRVEAGPELAKEVEASRQAQSEG